MITTLSQLAPAAGQANPLPLQGLQLPDAVSWWPLAPGWWLLITILCIATPLLVFLIFRMWRRNSDKRQAKKLLNSAYSQWLADQNQQQLILQLNTVLKRFCRQRFPKAISLSEQRWSDFLNHSAGTDLFSEKQSKALQSGAYQEQPMPALDEKDLVRNCQRWLSKAKNANLRETD